MVDMPLPPGAMPPIRVTTAAPRSPWAVMRGVLFALYLRELKTRLDGRWGSSLWVIGEPLLNLGATSAVYATLRATSVAGVDTLLFLVTGLLPFYMFRALVLQLMGAIDANQALFGYRQVKPFDAMLSRVGVELTLFVGMASLFFVGLVWMGKPVMPDRPLEVLGILVLLVLLGSAIGLLVAVATAAQMARARTLVRLLFFPLNLASGAMVPLASLPQGLRDVLMLNPLAHLIEGLREAIFGATYNEPPGLSVVLPVQVLLVVSFLGLGLYRIRRHRLLAS